MAKTGKQELGIAVSGAWAATLLDRWASLLGGERENNVARLVVGDVRVTAWDVSKVGRTLLPMWAARVEVLLSCLGAGPQECLHGAVDHLEEMLPSTPAAVVALADARAAPADAAVRRELERFGVDYYPSPPPPGVGGETGAFDAGARAMLEGLLKRRYAALPDRCPSGKQLACVRQTLAFPNNVAAFSTPDVLLRATPPSVYASRFAAT